MGPYISKGVFGDFLVIWGKESVLFVLFLFGWLGFFVVVLGGVFWKRGIINFICFSQSCSLWKMSRH